MATPLPKISTSQSQGGGLLDYIVKSVENAAGTAGNAITSGINTVGKAVGQQQLLSSPIPGTKIGPTLAQVADNTIGQIPGAPSTAILHGNETGMGMLALGTMMEGSGENPEDTTDTSDVLPEEENGAKYVAPAASINKNLKPSQIKANAGKNPVELNLVPPNAETTNAKFGYDNQSQTPLPKIGGTQPDLQTTQEQPSARQTPRPIIAPPPVRGTDEVGEPGSIKIYTKAGVNGAAREKVAQQATDNIPGLTANQKYTNMNSRMGELSQQIDDYNAANPKQVPSATLRSNYMGKISHLIAPDGTTGPEAEKMGMVTQDQANNLADNFIRQAELKAGVNPSIDPATSQKIYDIDQITKMKQEENNMTSPLLTKRFNGGDLKPQEQLRIAGRDAYDQTIGNVQPDIKKLSLEQSGLYDSVDSLDDARKNEDKEAFKAANQPKIGFGQKAKQFFSNPLVDVGLGAVGIKGLSSIPNIGAGALALGEGYIQNLTNPSSNQNNGTNSNGQLNQGPNDKNNNFSQNNHSQSISNYDPNVNSPANIPQKQTDLKQNPQGGYGIANIYSMKDPSDPSGNTNLFVSPNDVKAQQLAIDSAKNTLLYKNSQAEQVRVGKLQDQLNTQEKFTSQISDDYNSAETKNNAYNQALLDTKAAGPTLQNFNGTFDDFIKQISSQYGDLATQLKTLESEGAINPNGFIKGSTLFQALQTAAAGSLMKFYSKLSGVTGYTGQGSTGVQATPSTSIITPSSPMPKPNTANWGQATSSPTGTPMPPMGSFQQTGASFQ